MPPVKELYFMVNTIQMTQTGYDELAKELEEKPNQVLFVPKPYCY